MTIGGIGSPVGFPIGLIETAASVGTFETNVHFVASFVPTKLSIPQLILYQAQDIEPPVAETNVHFLARFSPAVLNVPQFLRQFYPDIEPPVVSDANPHFIGRFQAVVYNRLPLNAGWYSTLLGITDTATLQFPINCILMGQQDYEQGDTEIEANDPNIRTRTTVSDGGGGRLSGNESSFSVKTGNKGYD